MKTKGVLRMIRTGQATALPRRSMLLLRVDHAAWLRAIGMRVPEGQRMHRELDLCDLMGAQGPDTDLGGDLYDACRHVEWVPCDGRVTVTLTLRVYPGVDCGPRARLLRRLCLALRRDGGNPSLQPKRPTARECRRWCVSERWERTPILACGFARAFHAWDANERCVHCNRTRREALCDGFWSMDGAACPPCRVKWLAHCEANPL